MPLFPFRYRNMLSLSLSSPISRPSPSYFLSFSSRSISLPFTLSTCLLHRSTYLLSKRHSSHSRPVLSSRTRDISILVEHSRSCFIPTKRTLVVPKRNRPDARRGRLQIWPIRRTLCSPDPNWRPLRRRHSPTRSSGGSALMTAATSRAILHELISADQRLHIGGIVLDFLSMFCGIISSLIVINRDESSIFQR